MTCRPQIPVAVSNYGLYRLPEGPMVLKLRSIRLSQGVMTCFCFEMTEFFTLGLNVSKCCQTRSFQKHRWPSSHLSGATSLNQTQTTLTRNYLLLYWSLE